MKAIMKIRFLQAVIGIVFGCMICFGGGMDAQAIELRLSHHLPPTAIPAKALEQWAKRLETETNGGVKITIFPSETLAKGRDAYTSTAAGVCDIAFVNNVYEPSRWGLNNIVGQISLAIPTDQRGGQFWDQLWKKYPEMLKEFEGVHVFARTISGSIALHTKKMVRVPADIKGMKIAAMGESLKLLRSVGASPVGIPAGDWYMSLEKGMMEGVLCPINVLTDRGVEEILPFHVDLGMGQNGNVIIINLSRWNSLQPDIKAKFEGLNQWTTDLIIKALDDVAAEGWKKCRDRGQTIIKPTPEESKLWLAHSEPLVEDWIKINEKKGPTREMFEYAKKLREEIH